MTYASYTRGYKPAIWNLDGKVTPTNVFLPIKREDIDSYELGLKGTFLEKHLDSMPHSSRRTTRTSRCSPSIPTRFRPPSRSPMPARSGQRHELDSRALLPGDVRLTTSLAFIDAIFDTYDAATCYGSQTAAQGCLKAPSGNSYQVLSGKRMPNAPRWKAHSGWTSSCG